MFSTTHVRTFVEECSHSSDISATARYGYSLPLAWLGQPTTYTTETHTHSVQTSTCEEAHHSFPATHIVLNTNIVAAPSQVYQSRSSVSQVTGCTAAALRRLRPAMTYSDKMHSAHASPGSRGGSPAFYPHQSREGTPSLEFTLSPSSAPGPTPGVMGRLAMRMTTDAAGGHEEVVSQCSSAGSVSLDCGEMHASSAFLTPGQELQAFEHSPTPHEPSRYAAITHRRG
jgi:hypothetical protein